MKKKKSQNDLFDLNDGGAKGNELVPVDDSDSFIPDEWEFGDTQSLIKPALSDAELSSLLDEFESEHYTKLVDGGRIEGYFLGKGGEVQMKNPQNPSETRSVGTWRIRHPEGAGLVYVVPSSAQLDGKLGGIAPGKFVIIQRMGQTQTSAGRRVNNFIVLVSKKRRIEVDGSVAPPTSTPAPNSGAVAKS